MAISALEKIKQVEGWGDRTVEGGAGHHSE